MRILPNSASFSICALFLLAGCDGNSGGGGTGGGTTGTESTTRSDGCPVAVPVSGGECDMDLTCAYDLAGNKCATARRREAICVEGAWQVWTPTSCDPLPADAACNPVGKWKVELTGPYDPDPFSGEADQGPFFLDLRPGEDGVVDIEGYRASLSQDGCGLVAARQLSKSCSTLDGEQFCSTTVRGITLDLSTTPAAGTVELSCEGDCPEGGTAPAQATKVP